MDPNRWKQADSLLLSALERPPGERLEFLRTACAGDEELEKEVRSLLAAQEEAGSFLQGRAIDVAARNIAMAESTHSPLTGQTISHYRIEEKLGVGGMGIVWKARDTRLDRFVALKFLPAQMMSDLDRKRRFVQEARAASALNHPNIVTIHEIDRIGDADFIAMEFVPGKTLDQLHSRKRPRRSDAIRYGIQLADALAAAHAAGVVHRDLKPGNVMVNENGNVKVLDFGLAKLAERNEDLNGTAGTGGQGTAEGLIVGTASFMSPEQAEGKRVDARSDIFSFGAVLYEMITGKRAFAGDSVVSILSAILRDQPTPASEIVTDVPRDLERIVARCLEKDPSRRYQHAGDLKIDLEQVNEASAAGRAAKRSVAHWWWLVAAAGVAASFVAGWRLHAPVSVPPQWTLTRLTSDAGFSSSSALSPDGKLVAYSSDRGGDGQWDLYVKQVAGGQPIRVTSDGSMNTSPDFSPDGAKILFRSNRNGGGIYEIPAFGGEARLVARKGQNPKYSPDGKQVAYWIGGVGIAAAVPGSGDVWVAPIAGGEPRRLATNLTAARYPIWAPDGKRVLMIGYNSQRAYENAALDWWLAALDGKDAIKTGAYGELYRAGLRPADFKHVSAIQPYIPQPGCWPGTGSMVTFSIQSGDTQNWWEIGISPETGKTFGVPKRLTVGAGNEVELSCASGNALTFTNAESVTDIWALPFDLNGGRAKGPLERIVQGPANRHHVSLSADGRYAAFGSDQTGRSNIWIRDLASGKEWVATNSAFYERFPVMNSSGSRIAFSTYEENDKRSIYVAAPGGPPVRVCEACLRATDWSRDDKVHYWCSAAAPTKSTFSMWRPIVRRRSCATRRINYSSPVSHQTIGG